MRPNEIRYQTKLYECPNCGARTSDPVSRTCADCGADLLHLGVGRDL